MVPSVVNLAIRSKKGFRFKLWLPLFILWPVVLVLFLAALPFLFLAEVVLRISGAPLQIFRLIGALFSVISSLRGTVIKVESHTRNAQVNISVK